MEVCDFGCDKEAIYFFKSSKKWCCSKSPNSCAGKRSKDSNKKKGINPFENKEHPRGMLGKKPWNSGNTYEILLGKEKADLLKKKLSKANKGINTWDKLPTEQQEKIRKKLRNHILTRYENGWMPKAGRCKKYKYNSLVAGEVSLDGTWELTVAKWLDKQHLTWQRNTKRFPYIHLNGKLSHYTPDFWIEEWNSYLEVKGYETKLDRCKWSQFKNNLIVWRKKDIVKITEGGQDGNAADC